MNIQNNNYNISPALSFKSCVKGNSVTDILRTDMDWNSFINILARKYKNTPKVEMRVIGCADCSEAFQTSMLLIHKMGKKAAEKFFPIKAWDIDSKILQNPRNGIIMVTQSDIARLEKYMGKDYLKYISIDKIFKKDPETGMVACKGKIKPILKDTVEIAQKDFTKSVSHIPGENSVIMSRNIWPYLPENKWSSLAKSIFDKLGRNSMMVVGEFELGSGFNRLFLDKGFEVFQWLGNSPCYIKPKKAC